MDNRQCSKCPGCKRHCSACNPKCGYGRKYFSACRKKQKRHKWEKYAEHGGLVWQLLDVSKKLKKALKQQEICEKDVLNVLSEQDRQQLFDLLSTVKKQLNYSE